MTSDSTLSNEHAEGAQERVPLPQNQSRRRKAVALAAILVIAVAAISLFTTYRSQQVHVVKTYHLNLGPNEIKALHDRGESPSDLINPGVK